MPKLLGIVGTLVICAGLDLLWQCRREIRFWVSAYVKVFREVLRRQEPRRPLPSLMAFLAVVTGDEAAEKKRGAVRFLLGMSFAFLLGPILIALSIANF